MDVDGQSHVADAGEGTTPHVGAQMALTPLNHSPMTARVKEIVDRARAISPHVVASPPAGDREVSLTRGRTFMQGRTCPRAVLMELEHESPKEAVQPSNSTQAAGCPMPTMPTPSTTATGADAAPPSMDASAAAVGAATAPTVTAAASPTHAAGCCANHGASCCVNH
jgi:hypothetical protein